MLGNTERALKIHRRVRGRTRAGGCPRRGGEQTLDTAESPTNNSAPWPTDGGTLGRRALIRSRCSELLVADVVRCDGGRSRAARGAEDLSVPLRPPGAACTAAYKLGFALSPPDMPDTPNRHSRQAQPTRPTRPPDTTHTPNRYEEGEPAHPTGRGRAGMSDEIRAYTRRPTPSSFADVGSSEFLGEVRRWIDRLGLQSEETAHLVGMDQKQLERLLNFPELGPSLKQVLQVLDGLGLGIVGVEPLTSAMVVRWLDRCREARNMTKVALAERAECNRTHLTFMFQHQDPDPKLETVLKLALALECELRIEQRREIPRPVVDTSAPKTAPSSGAATATQSRPPQDRMAAADPEPPRGPSVHETTRPTSPSGTSARPPGSTSSTSNSSAHAAPTSVTSTSSGPAPPRAVAAEHAANGSGAPRQGPSAASTARTPPSGPAPPRTARSETMAPPTHHATTSASDRTGAEPAEPPSASLWSSFGTTPSTRLPHLDPTQNPALDDAFRRVTQAQEAELEAQRARFRLELELQRRQHERELAEHRANERLLAEEEARSAARLVGGSAASTALGALALLTFQNPENRRTAQAALSLGGGLLVLVGGLAARGSTTRNLCLSMGLTATAIGAGDFVTQSLGGPRGGVGIKFQKRTDALVVDATLPRSAATVAGLLAGDEIVTVDGLSVAHLGVDDARRRLSGSPGTLVHVGVRRQTPMNLYQWDVTLTRTPT